MVEGSFAGDPQGYVKEGSGNWQLSLKVPCWGPWRGVLLVQGH